MATATSSKKAVKITGEGRYPLVPVDRIEIVERPEEGREAEQLFFNPRSLDSFDSGEMEELLISVRTDGLQQPPQVRAITENGKVVAVQLIAGERRLRTLKKIIENDYSCFDEDAKPPKKYRSGATVLYKGRFAKVLSHKASGVTIQMYEHTGIELIDDQRDVMPEDLRPTVPGSKLYREVPCRVLHDCNDERALRVAFGENDKHKSLKTKEEIALVERLLAMDLKQGEIAEILGTNETWVSQTLNFRNALPKGAYDKLLTGDMTRHVAVQIMGFHEKDRERIFQEAVQASEEDADKRSDAAQNELERAEDDEEIALADKRIAEDNDDAVSVRKADRTASSAQKRAAKAQDKKERVEDERGQIKQSHVSTAASKTKTTPKKAKMLTKDQIQQVCIDGAECLVDGETVHPEYEECVPSDIALAIQETAKFIVSGSSTDIFDIVTQVQVKLGNWSDEVAEAEEVDPDEALLEEPAEELAAEFEEQAQHEFGAGDYEDFDEDELGVYAEADYDEA